MRIRVLTIGFVLTLSSFAAMAQVPALPPVPPAPELQPSPDLVGVYIVSGFNPDGTTYEGVVDIGKVNEAYSIEWSLDDGVVRGVGVYRNGALVVSYFSGAPAIVVYKVQGKQLVGEWTMGGMNGRLSTETLTRTTEEAVKRAVPLPRASQRPLRPPGYREI